MQMRLKRLGIYLVIASVLLCVLVVVIGLVRRGDRQEMITLGVALAVSVIPEGLVAVVTGKRLFIEFPLGLSPNLCS
jgi:Ca2+-transporting ATPase